MGQLAGAQSVRGTDRPAVGKSKGRTDKKAGKRRAPYKRAVFWAAVGLPILFVLWMGLLFYTLPNTAGEPIDLATFNAWLGAGEVEQIVLLDYDTRAVVVRDGEEHWLELPDNALYINTLVERIEQSGASLIVDQQELKGLLEPASLAVPALMLVLAFLLVFGLMRGGGGGAFVRSAAQRGASERPVTFADVAGTDDAIAEIREVRDYLMAPVRFEQIGAVPPRGILLVGPPGTGKTLLARACAGEAGVPFFSISGSDFNEMYVGVGAARVRDLFRRVRESAPAILFIDEIDAMGRIRGTQGQDERDQTLNQLLVELDGFHTSTGVVLIGATNRVDVLDPALLRRGRFDRRILVDRPDRGGRQAILDVHARSKRIDPSVSLAKLADQTPGFTGADLASVMNEAALLAARRHEGVITSFDIEEAIERLMSGSDGRVRVLSDREKFVVACHEVGHTVAAWALPDVGAVNRVSIMGSGRGLGSTHVITPEDRFVVDRAQLKAQIAVAMAGRAAEEVVVGQPASTSRDDLRRATGIARQMVCEYGMSEILGRRALGRPMSSEHLDDGRIEADYSGEVAAQIDREIGRFLDEGFEQAAEVIRTNRAVFDRVVELLVAQETLREPDLAPYARDVHPPGRPTRG